MKQRKATQASAGGRLASSADAAGLPVKLQSELHPTRIVHRTGDQPKGGILHIRATRIEARTVERVEHLPPEVKTGRFGETELLGEREVLFQRQG